MHLNLFAVAASLIGPQSAPTASAPPPNIVFILADDHATNALGCYGSPVAHTPNLDRLAAEGMRFERFACGNAICSPSRASMLTGVHSHVHGVVDNVKPLDGAQPNFPKQLQAADYRTALFGKWHLHAAPTGFDTWDVLPEQGVYYDPKLRNAQGEHATTGYVTEVLTDLALSWLDKRDVSKPFLLCLHHKAPHRSWLPGPSEFALYRDEALPEPATLFDDYATRARGAGEAEMTVARHLTDYDLKLGDAPKLAPAALAAWRECYDAENAALRASKLEGAARTRWNHQRFVKDYLRCIAGIDASVGRVLAYLDAHDLARYTLVVYVSDQGFFLGEHGWYDKRWMYEEALLAPLIVRWPGVVAPGSVERHLAQNIDIAPTLIECARAAPIERAQGLSLVPLLRGAVPADWRTSIYYRYYEFPVDHRVQPHYGVRTDNAKLIYFPQLDRWEMYDLERDPHELVNLAGVDEHKELRAKLEAELTALRTRYGDSTR